MTSEGPSPAGNDDGSALPHGREFTDEQKRRRREANRAWRERNPEKIAQAKREWVAANKEHVDAYRRNYLQKNRAKVNETSRAWAQKQRAQEEDRQRRRDYAKAYYEKNKAEILAKQKAARDRRRAEDPEAFRTKTRERNQRWYAKHTEDARLRAREYYWANHDRTYDNGKRWYRENAEKVAQQKADAYWADPKTYLMQQRRRRATATRSRRARLPSQALHPIDVLGIRAREEQATQFFARRRTADEVRQIRDQPLRDASSGGGPTPPELIQAWKEDCANARELDFPHTAPEDLSPRLAIRKRRMERIRQQQIDIVERTVQRDVNKHERLQRVESERRAGVAERAAARAAAKEAEEARMDAIGRQINDRYRIYPRPQPRLHRPDPAAPFPGPGTQSGRGLSR